jgi:hypothetical protein
MSNPQRECSEFVYNLSRQQMEALMAIAKNQDRPFLEVVMEAVDQYIQRETCQTP